MYEDYHSDEYYPDNMCATCGSSNCPVCGVCTGYPNPHDDYCPQFIGPVQEP